MEEALYETTILRQFSGLNVEQIPDEATILNFRRLQVLLKIVEFSEVYQSALSK